MSEFLILTTTFAREPWLAPLPAFGLMLAFGALLLRLQGMLFGAPSAPSDAARASSFPFALHLLLVLIAGLYLPGAPGGLVPAGSGVSGMSGLAVNGLSEIVSDSTPDGDGFIRANVTEDEWNELGLACAKGHHDLTALWFDADCMRMALISRDSAALISSSVGMRLSANWNSLQPPTARTHRGLGVHSAWAFSMASASASDGTPSMYN